MAAQSSSQYRKISEFSAKLWTPESPVIVEKCMLQYDRVYGTNVLQITFRNVSQMNIYGLSVIITLKNDRGAPLGQEISYNYYGMEVEPDRTFGAEEDIVVEKDASRFDIRVVRAELSDGQVFRGSAQLSAMPQALPLSSLGDMEDDFVDRVHQLQPKLKVICAPERKENYWRCICEKIYPNDFDSCSGCKVKADDLFSILADIKRERKKQAEAEAQAEKAREEEENRQREELQRLEEIDRLRREEEERKKREQAEAEARRQKEEEERKAAEEARKAEEAARLQAEKEAEQKKRRTRIISLVSAAAVIAAFLIWGLPFIKDRIDARKPVEEEEPVETAAPAEVTPAPEATPAADETGKEDAGKEESIQESEPEDIPDGEKILILGSDLSVAGEETLWRLFGEDREKAEGLTTMTVSAKESHRYLDVTLGSKHIESEAISGMLITKLPQGSGLDINLYNIDYCTRDMYEEALAELGITDARVVVAAPVEASGSSALAGLWKLSGSDAGEDDVIGYLVAIRPLTIRTGADMEYPAYAQVDIGTVVPVVEVLSSGWYRVIWGDSDDGYGYTGSRNGKYYEAGEFLAIK